MLICLVAGVALLLVTVAVVGSMKCSHAWVVPCREGERLLLRCWHCGEDRTVIGEPPGPRRSTSAKRSES